ncbi:MAG: hypothetical protein U0166_19015 [Acidobacteriota bacterium]
MRTPTAAVILALGLSAIASGSEVLPFIEDDYGKALAEAREKKLPIFMEAWAPW